MSTWKMLKLDGKTYPKYSVSCKGEIKNNFTSHILSSKMNSSGYISTMLYLDGKMKLCRNHRVVAETFIPNPDRCKYVKFLDNNSSNIDVNNLYWTSHTDKGKASTSRVSVIDSFGVVYSSIQQAANTYNLSPSVIGRHIHNSTSTSEGVTFSIWRDNNGD